MPEPMMGGAEAGTQPAPASTQGQATGTNPATTPVANRGIEAQAEARIAVYVQGLTNMLPSIPAGSDMAKDVRDAITKLAKYAPQGAVSPGIQNTEAQRMAMQQRQAGPQVAAMRASQMSEAPQPAAAGGAM